MDWNGFGARIAEIEFDGALPNACEVPALVPVVVKVGVEIAEMAGFRTSFAQVGLE
jgi:hypothetical protein